MALLWRENFASIAEYELRNINFANIINSLVIRAEISAHDRSTKVGKNCEAEFGENSRISIWLASQVRTG